MDELNAWSTFLTTGSVLDYLRYKALQDTRDTGADTISENRDEIQDQRTDNKGAEYR